MRSFFQSQSKCQRSSEHPLRDNVVVGNFKLKESIDSKNIETGNSFNYEFEIVGEGNISAINEPEIYLNNIELYSPNSEQIIKRERGKVFGSKNIAIMAYLMKLVIMISLNMLIGFF